TSLPGTASRGRFGRSHRLRARSARLARRCMLVFVGATLPIAVLAAAHRDVPTTGVANAAVARSNAAACLVTTADGPGVIRGTDGADTLTGTAGNDTIYGFGGADTINGLGGDDLICGGDGPDVLVGG